MGQLARARIGVWRCVRKRDGTVRCSYKPEFIADTALQPDGVVAPITLIYRTLHFVDVHERKKRAQTVTGLDESKHGLGPVEVLIRAVASIARPACVGALWQGRGFSQRLSSHSVHHPECLS